MSESDLIEKARQFERVLMELENKQTIFSKKQLEDYHSILESSFDENMSILEESILRENKIPAKEKYYTKLFNFLRTK